MELLNDDQDEHITDSEVISMFEYEIATPEVFLFAEKPQSKLGFFGALNVFDEMPLSMNHKGNLFSGVRLRLGYDAQLLVRTNDCKTSFMVMFHLSTNEGYSVSNGVKDKVCHSLQTFVLRPMLAIYHVIASGSCKEVIGVFVSMSNFVLEPASNTYIVITFVWLAVVSFDPEGGLVHEWDFIVPKLMSSCEMEFDHRKSVECCILLISFVEKSLQIIQAYGCYLVGWPEFLQALVNCLDSNDLNHMEGALEVLLRICEDVPQVLDSNMHGSSEPPISVFLPLLFQLFQSPHALLRTLSLDSVNQYIMLMPAALYASMDKYLWGLFALAQDPSAEVRTWVCAAIVQLIEVRPSFLEPHLRNVIEYMFQINKSSDAGVALEACECWYAYCDALLPPENLSKFLPRLLPILFSNIVYSDDDESLVDGEEDESPPDRD